MTLSRFAAIVVHWAWLILLAGALGSGAAFFITKALPVEYEAEARVLIGSLGATSYDEQLSYQQLAATYASLATIDPILDHVITQLQLTDTRDQLAGRLSVRAPLNERVVIIGATGPSPQSAAQLANAVAAQVVGLGPASANPASIVQPAVPPTDPSSPHVLVDTLIGGVLGLALGTCAALLLSGWRQLAADRRSRVSPRAAREPERSSPDA